jgi:spore coat polysaccharide biosynthesis predicted glycosyltransferase SpsG
MDGLNQTIIGGIIVEAIVLLVVMFKTVPVLENQLKNACEEQDRQSKIIDTLKTGYATQTVVLAEHRKDYDNIKRDFDEHKQLNKEVYSDMKKTVEECTKAIIQLEITMQLLRERI